MTLAEPYFTPPAFLLKPTTAPYLLDPPPAGKPPWHAVRTASGLELGVSDAIQRLSFEVYCPRYTASYLIRNRRREVISPYLRTYLFARWDAADAYAWHDLRDIKGVLGFIGGAVPDPISNDEIELLRSYIGDDGELVGTNVIRQKLIPVGEEVLINRNAFAGYLGVVEEADEDGVFVSVKIGGLLGRDLAVTIPAEWCDRLKSQGALSQESTAQGGPRRLSKRRRERSKRAEG